MGSTHPARTAETLTRPAALVHQRRTRRNNLARVGGTALALAVTVTAAHLVLPRPADDGAPRVPQVEAVHSTPHPTAEPAPVPASTPRAAGGLAAPIAAATTAPPLSYWPGPSTTGVPVGTVLTDSGSLALRTNGQVISNLNITGCVNVYARNVIIRKSRITCDSTTFSIRTFDSAVNLVVEDVEINGKGRNSTAVCCGNYTLRRVNIWNVIDGPRLGNNTMVVDSWIHDLFRVTASHNDTLQTTGGNNITVRHNRLDVYKPSTDDPFNACLMVGSTTGPSVTNLLFTDNYCNGGNWSIGVRTDLVATNVAFRANRYGRDYRYGIMARPSQTGIIWETATNLWLDTSLPVVP